MPLRNAGCGQQTQDDPRWLSASLKVVTRALEIQVREQALSTSHLTGYEVSDLLKKLQMLSGRRKTTKEAPPSS